MSMSVSLKISFKEGSLSTTQTAPPFNIFIFVTSITRIIHSSTTLQSVIRLPRETKMMAAAAATGKSALFYPHPHPADNKSSRSCCCCSKNNIPKLEPFSRSKFERGLREPPLIDKSQNQLADYCTVLEGESSYSCWEAYFELKDLQKEYTKEEVERLIIDAGGLKSLIACLHGVAAIHKQANSNTTLTTHSQPQADPNNNNNNNNDNGGHIPDGLPMTTQQLEEQENAKMPDSAYTRLLRHTQRAALPAWYSPAPN